MWSAVAERSGAAALDRGVAAWSACPTPRSRSRVPARAGLAGAPQTRGAGNAQPRQPHRLAQLPHAAAQKPKRRRRYALPPHSKRAACRAHRALPGGSAPSTAHATDLPRVPGSRIRQNAGDLWATRRFARSLAAAATALACGSRDCHAKQLQALSLREDRSSAEREGLPLRLAWRCNANDVVSAAHGAG